MAKCFELEILPIWKSTFSGNSKKLINDHQVEWLLFPEEVEFEMQSILAKFELSPSRLFSAVESNARFQFKRMPWAVIFFRDEYPLAGHLMSIRPNPDDIKFSSYTFVKDRVISYDPKTAGTPPISFMWIFTKQSLLVAASTGSLLVKQVWETLKNKSEERSWVVITDALDQAWINSKKIESDQQFFNYYQ